MKENRHIEIGGPNLQEGQHTWCERRRKEDGRIEVARLDFGTRHPVDEVPNHEHLTQTGRARYVDSGKPEPPK